MNEFFLIIICYASLIPLLILTIILIIKLLKLKNIVNLLDNKLSKLFDNASINLKKHEEINFAIRKDQEKNLKISRAIRILLTKYKGQELNTTSLKELSEKIDQFITSRKENSKVSEESFFKIFNVNDNDNDFKNEIDEDYNNMIMDLEKNDYLSIEKLDDEENSNKILDSMERKQSNNNIVTNFFEKFRNKKKKKLEIDNDFISKNIGLKIENISSGYNKDGEKIV